MKCRDFLFLGLCVGVLWGCGQSNASYSVSVSAGSQNQVASKSGVSSGDQTQSLTLAGQIAKGSLAGDTVEIKSGVVTVNGKSYGAVSMQSEVKYVVTPESRKLYVDGAERNALP